MVDADFALIAEELFRAHDGQVRPFRGIAPVVVTAPELFCRVFLKALIHFTFSQHREPFQQALGCGSLLMVIGAPTLDRTGASA